MVLSYSSWTARRENLVIVSSKKTNMMTTLPGTTRVEIASMNTGCNHQGDDALGCHPHHHHHHHLLLFLLLLLQLDMHLPTQLSIRILPVPLLPGQLQGSTLWERNCSPSNVFWYLHSCNFLLQNLYLCLSQTFYPIFQFFTKLQKIGEGVTADICIRV